MAWLYGLSRGVWGPAALLPHRDLDGTDEGHGAPPLVPAVDGGPVEVVLQCLLLAGAWTDLEQPAIGTDADFDGLPGASTTGA